jgi:PPM family protein phosphatase
MREGNGMNCPNCGKANNEEEKFCEECGAQLSEKPVADQAEKAAESLLKVGQEFKARYSIISAQNLGKGTRYQARDATRKDSEVIILEKSMNEPDAESMKLQWEALKPMNSPHFPVFIDFFEEGGRNYLVLDKIIGESLEEIMKKEKPSLAHQELLTLGISMCDTVGLLHQKNILHRDLQPSNFFITPDKVLLLSGFDRICYADNVPGECAVTPGFSSPEAYGIGEGRMDFRSDIYSIGATLYSLISGKTPLLDQRENFFAFPPLSEYKIKINPRFEAAIMTAVSKKAEGRFQGIAEFRKALEDVLNEPEATAPAEENQVLSMNIGMKSDIGKVREINQDSCLFMNFATYEKSELREGALFIVADGMGGEAEGDKASSLAIRVISKYVLEKYLPTDIGAKTQKLESLSSNERLMSLLGDALREANRVVFEYAQQDVTRKGMGSTISTAIIDGNNLIVGHAGDTRVYIVGEKIEQVSEDHSLVGRLVKMGQLKKEDALKSPQRSLVYRALGTNPELEVDTFDRKLKAGDCILLCSDGVWEYYTDDELLAIFKEYKDPQEICDRLVELCLERGADDNCTAIIVKMGDASQ